MGRKNAKSKRISTINPIKIETWYNASRRILSPSKIGSMQNFSRDKQFGGNRGRKPFGDRQSSGPREMFDATCAECGNNCKIPFMPRQGKPVYCSNCFEKVEADRDRDGEGRAPRSNNFDHPRFDRPNFDKPNFVRRDKPAAPTVNLYEVNQKLDALSEKLDQVLHALTHQE